MMAWSRQVCGYKVWRREKWADAVCMHAGEQQHNEHAGVETGKLLRKGTRNLGELMHTAKQCRYDA